MSEQLEKAEKAYFVATVHRLLGSSDQYSDLLEKMFADYGNNPRWAAVMVMKMIAGPDNLDMVREYAAAMGFDPDRV
jgi:hypothetical protein